jgi:acetoacetyl-CoA synthetase
MDEALWTPSEASKASSNIAAFMARRGCPSWQALYDWSLAESETFWSEVWDFAGIIGEKGAKPWIAEPQAMPGARFFPKGTLNYAENLLREGGAEEALVCWAEDHGKLRLTREGLREQAGRFQRWLAAQGITPGDRLAAIMPNVPQSLAAFLGASAMGAVWSSCSPDFGEQGVLDRFGQIGPRVLVACDGYIWNAKTFDIREKLQSIIAALPSLERVVVMDWIGEAQTIAHKLARTIIRPGVEITTWTAALESQAAGPPHYTPLPFNHPLYILYSSGTTGVPKCIVHSAGGVLLKHMSEHLLHADVKANDRVFYYTTLGWMMWNWLISGLAAGATLLLYDGSPVSPNANILWDFADAEGCTHFGTSAKYIDTIKKAGLAPRETHDLSALRVIMSTGSVLVPESFDYVYQDIKRNVHLASISGGTDLCGCFVASNPLAPVWRGEIQGPALGLKICVVDESGDLLPRGKGELVCANAFPSMPLGFWNDADASRYRAAYFERFPGLWHHGDFAEWTEHGGMIIHGRSDATLNPGGVRIGTAEIYRQVEQLSEIQESICVGQDVAGDVRVLLFVVLKPGNTLDADLKDRIKRKIREGASPRHVPAEIIAVADIPRTRSGKISELAVRDIVMGRPVKNTEALANPHALDLFRMDLR